MHLLPQPYFSLALLLTSIGITAFGLTRWRLRHIRPTAAPGSALMFCTAFWIMTNGFEAASSDAASALFWNKLQYAGIAPLPILWLYLTLQFTNRERLLTRPRLLLVSAVPIICLIMALTNDYHHLFQTNLRIESDNAFTSVHGDTQFFRALFYTYAYILLAAGTLLLVQRMAKTTGFRWQGAMVILGMVLGVTANLLDLSGYSPSPNLKLTPIGVAIAVPLFIVSLYRVRRADLVPIARSSVIELMQDPVMVLDVENRLIDANPATLALLGRGLNGTMGRFIKDELPELASQIEQLPSIGERSYEIKLKRNGELRTYDVLISALDGWRGHTASRVLVLRDVTDRARAEEALRLSEESYRLHFANVSDVVFSYDKNLVILSMTPSIEQHLGLKPEECLGKTIVEIGILAPEFLEEAAANILRAMGGERVDGARYECIARDGRRLTAEISGNPIVVGNEVVEIVNVARDVTERVRAERALKASLEEKELLLKEIHHRVKNNMQIISSLLSLQSRAVESPMLRAQLEDSQNRIRTMALVHERLYRSEDLSSIEMSSYLRDLTGNLLQTHPERGEPVSFTFGMEPLTVDIDTAIPSGLIVNELITNSLKHAFKGVEKPQLSLEGRCAEGGIYQITVRDNGVGLAPAQMPPHNKSLGLKLITSLTKQLKGTFSLESQSGTSAVLSFAIDRTTAAAAHPRSPVSNEMGTSHPELKQVMEG